MALAAPTLVRWFSTASGVWWFSCLWPLHLASGFSHTSQHHGGLLKSSGGGVQGSCVQDGLRLGVRWLRPVFSVRHCVQAVSGPNKCLVWLCGCVWLLLLLFVRIGRCFEALNELFSGEPLSLRADHRGGQNYRIPTLGWTWFVFLRQVEVRTWLSFGTAAVVGVFTLSVVTWSSLCLGFCFSFLFLVFFVFLSKTKNW